MARYFHVNPTYGFALLHTDVEEGFVALLAQERPDHIFGIYEEV